MAIQHSVIRFEMAFWWA